MLKRMVILTLLLATSLGAEPMMTLEDAIALGLKNNYNIQIARRQADISANNRGQGLAGFLPTIDAAADYNRSDSEQETNLPPSITHSLIDNWNAEVSLNWTLFDGFRMFTNLKKFNELSLQGEYLARDQIENSIVAISRAYYNLVQQELLLQISRDTRDISETRLDRERIRKELGGASSTDFLNAQVAFNIDQSALLERELQVKIVRQQLNVLLGQNPSAEYQVSPEIIIPPQSLEYLQILDLALERNSSLKATELNKRIADREVQNARSAFLPRVWAYSSYGYRDQTINSDADQYPGLNIGTQTGTATVGLSLSYNLFNGRRNKIELDNARIEANNRSLILRDARNRLMGLVQETYETYRLRIEVIALEEQNIEAARQNLDLQWERLELGSVNSLEFRDAQVSLAQAQTSLVTARYQARISRLELDYLIGNINIE